MQVADYSVELIDHMGSDLSVVNAARVSFANTSTWEENRELFEDDAGDEVERVIKVLSTRDQGLIRYLANHKHTSPFNHAFVTFRVRACIAVARQLVKHKFMPWNEESRRYIDGAPTFFIPDVFRQRAENVKQGSAETPVVLNVAVRQLLIDHSELCLETYHALLDAGVCPEQARLALPLNTNTEWIWSGTLGAVADMCKLRLDPHAQKESRDIAAGIDRVMAQLYPHSWKALVHANTTD